VTDESAWWHDGTSFVSGRRVGADGGDVGTEGVLRRDRRFEAGQALGGNDNDAAPPKAMNALELLYPNLSQTPSAGVLRSRFPKLGFVGMIRVSVEKAVAVLRPLDRFLGNDPTEWF